jgi:hypothetical protein
MMVAASCGSRRVARRFSGRRPLAAARLRFRDLLASRAVLAGTETVAG